MVLDKFRLDGQTAVVTGGSRGIGQSIAVAFAEAGADIIVVSRGDAEQTLSTVREIGRTAVACRADLGQIEDYQAFFQQLRKLAPSSLSLLVNNAGVVAREDCAHYSESDWDTVFDTNLKSLFFLSQQFGRYWIASKLRGKIINVASLLSFQGGIRVAAYTASKHGVAGVTKSLANEWAAHGINVNAIAPGYVKTDINSVLRQNAQRNREIVERIPAGDWGTPADMQGLALLLASQASNYIHGAVIPVDGGWLAR